MRWLYRLVWLIGALLPMGAQAQAVGLARPDSVVRRPNVARLPHNRFVVQYDSRYSILNHHLTTINGLKLGLEFKSRFRTGAAIYFLSTGVPSRQAKPDNAAEDADAEIRFRYLAAYAGYVLLENRRWELSANLQVGLGSAFVLYAADGGGSDQTPREFMGIVEPTLAAQYRVFRWSGIGTGLGWRQPVFVPIAIQKELNGPVFYLRANLFLGDLIKVLKDKEPLFTQTNMR
ncbi:hypothetical protein MON38_17590 [Hymenobacter sp. DH14]|uniref:DUF6089 domain-containing protein n=1 Tax=Hymenobacter cyanobacteriorum TaxID=2926463 RepID=A0A9X1VI29_9BACT|nr:hypothetical protein [Hymenobacter cyanobacteriorum]MCI1189241.1 hypothetical protein [Hymenobacter cyanobacteriorum]